LKTKAKGRHFDTTEVIEAESHAVLNTLTEQDFQAAFFTDGSISPRNYGYLNLPFSSTHSCNLLKEKSKIELFL
jgi:hypothetical protein